METGTESGALLETRERILIAAFDEIHQVGFQAASLNQIIKRAGLTKGAFYHYFQSKDQLGLCILDEAIRSNVRDRWVKPLQDAHDPIERFKEILSEAGNCLSDEELERGCPLNNLAQEMSPISEKFRLVIQSIFADWMKSIEDALVLGIKNKTVSSQVDPKSASALILSSLEGVIGIAKTARSREFLANALNALFIYLDSLKPEESRDGSR